MKNIKLNPIFRKEATVRTRSWKFPFMIAMYIGVLILIGSLILYNTVFNPDKYIFNINDLAITYVILAGIQFLLIAFIVPALTASSISNEREKQTLDLLLCTKLKPKSIILGKLETCISQVLLLIICGLPVFSVIFLFGGISFKEILLLLLYYIILAITFGSIGIFFSTYTKKTTTATVLTYGVLLFLIIGTVIINSLYINIKANQNYNIDSIKMPLMYLNPSVGFASMMIDQIGANLRLQSLITQANKTPLWVINMIINIITSIVLLVLSTHKLNPMKKK